MKNILHSIVAILSVFVLTSCDIDPRVIQERLFNEGGGADYQYLEEIPANPPDEHYVPGRMCVPVTDLIAASASGPDWLQQEVTNPVTGASGGEVGPLTYIIYQIYEQVNVATENIFTLIADNTTFQAILGYMAQLAIIFFGIGLIAGIIPAQPFPLLVLVAKLSIVFALATNWEFFNSFVRDFFEGIVNALIAQMSLAFTGAATSEGNLIFNPADAIFARFFSMEYTLILLATLTTGMTGFFYGFTLLLTTFGFLIAVLRALYIYLTALVVRSLLYILAPLFLSFLMLRVTKTLFDNWIRQLVSFSLQPILLFSFLGVFFVFIEYYITQLSIPSFSGGTHVCYMEFVAPDGIDKVLYWWGFSGERGINRLVGVEPEIGISLVTLFAMMIMSYVMVLFGTWAVDVAHHLSQGLMTSARAVAPGWASLRQRMLKPVAGAAGATRGFATGVGRNPFGHKSGSSFHNGAQEGMRILDNSVRREDRSLKNRTLGGG